MLTELRPAHSYERIPPSLFNMLGSDLDMVRALYRLFAQQQVVCPAEGVELHEHCYISDGCHVLDEVLEWVPESVLDYGIAETIKPVLQDVIRGGHHKVLPASGRRTVVIAKAGADNYGHTVTEILPKLINIGRAKLGPILMVLPTAMQHFEGLISALLQHLGVDAELVFHPPATLVLARDVYRFTAVGRHNTRKSATFLELADVLRSMYHIRHERRQRIYVRRASADYRNLQNSAAIEAAFAQHGFAGVYPAELTIEEQITLFASASHISGVMGAGLANIGWAPPGCEVFVIDPGLGDAYFWDLACLLRQPYSWMIAQPLHGYSAENAVADFSVDEPLLTTMLKLIYS